MSDVMLLGVLRMPPNLWNDSPIDVAQRHSRYKQAADTIEQLRKEVDAAAKICEIYYNIASEVIGEEAVRIRRDEAIMKAVASHVNWESEEAKAMLAGNE